MNQDPLLRLNRARFFLRAHQFSHGHRQHNRPWRHRMACRWIPAILEKRRRWEVLWCFDHRQPVHQLPGPPTLVCPMSQPGHGSFRKSERSPRQCPSGLMRSGEATRASMAVGAVGLRRVYERFSGEMRVYTGALYIRGGVIHRVSGWCSRTGDGHHVWILYYLLACFLWIPQFIFFACSCHL